MPSPEFFLSHPPREDCVGNVKHSLLSKPIGTFLYSNNHIAIIGCHQKYFLNISPHYQTLLITIFNPISRKMSKVLAEKNTFTSCLGHSSPVIK